MIKFSVKYIKILAVSVFLTIFVTVIITVMFTISLVNGNSDNAVVGGIFIGAVSGVGFVVLFAPFYMRTVRCLGERLEWEQPDKGILMPITDEKIQQMSDETYQQLHVDWLELISKTL